MTTDLAFVPGCLRDVHQISERVTCKALHLDHVMMPCRPRKIRAAVIFQLRLVGHSNLNSICYPDCLISSERRCCCNAGSSETSGRQHMTCTRRVCCHLTSLRLPVPGSSVQMGIACCLSLSTLPTTTAENFGVIGPLASGIILRPTIGLQDTSGLSSSGLNATLMQFAKSPLPRQSKRPAMWSLSLSRAVHHEATMAALFMQQVHANCKRPRRMVLMRAISM